METIFTTQNIIQGGGVIIALFAIGLLYKISSNHISHNTKTLVKLENAINRLIEVIERKL